MKRRAVIATIGIALVLVIGIVVWKNIDDRNSHADVGKGRARGENTSIDNRSAGETEPESAELTPGGAAMASGLSDTSRTSAESSSAVAEKAIAVSHKLTGAGSNSRLSLQVTNHGITPLTLDRNRATDPIRALQFFDEAGKRVPTVPPALPIDGSVVIQPGKSEQFDYHLNIFSPPLKPGHYSIHVSFVRTDPISWEIPEQ